MAFLDISHVKHAYGNTPVLHDIDLEVAAGEFLVLVGPSGCGKSTLLNLIAGLEKLTAGRIAIDGVRVDDRPPAQRDIAMVFQSYALYPNMTVRDNLGFGLRMRGVDRGARARAVGEVAALLQIEELLDRKPRALSGGQRQRVAMGRALVRKPRLFLFDEPLSNLDARLRIEMRSMIKRLHRQIGTTTVYVTHDQVEAMTLASRIAVMSAGRLQQVGRPEDVYARPANMFVAGFMGAPPMNLITAALERERGRLTLRVELAGGDFATLTVPEASVPVEYERTEVVLGLRPEAIVDAPRGGASANPGERARAPADAAQRAGAVNVAGAARAPSYPEPLHAVDNRIDLVEPTGSDTYVVMRMGGADVVARLHADARPRAGESFRFSVDMGKCVLFDPVTQARIGEPTWPVTP